MKQWIRRGAALGLALALTVTAASEIGRAHV